MSHEYKYAASHPYSKGKKMKPEGAPHPYASKSKALHNKTSPEMKKARKGYNEARKADSLKTKRGSFKI